MCVEDGVWQRCVKDGVCCMWQTCVCERGCVAKMVCDKGVWQRYTKMVCDKNVCERWCETKVCVKDAMKDGVWWRVCVCVEHLNRCKTSTVAFCNFSNSHSAGGGSRVQSLPPTKTLWFPWWYMAWSAMRTCTFPFLRPWHAAKPRTAPTIFSTSCKFAAIWTHYGFTLLAWASVHFRTQRGTMYWQLPNRSTFPPFPFSSTEFPMNTS